MFRVVRSWGLANVILCVLLTAWPPNTNGYTLPLDKNAGKVFTNGWAIKVEGGIEIAKRIARSHGFDKAEPVSGR